MTAWIKKILGLTVACTVIAGLFFAFLCVFLFSESHPEAYVTPLFIIVAIVFGHLLLFSVFLSKLHREMDARFVSDAMAISELKKRIEELEK